MNDPTKNTPIDTGKDSRWELETKRVIELQDADGLQRIALVGQALSSPTRLEILRLINVRPYLMSEISNELNIQPSSAAFHLKMLESAELVSVDYSTKHKGTLKYYSYGTRDIVLRLRPAEGIRDRLTPYVQSIAIGDFVDIALSDNCGFATDMKMIMADDPHSAFHPDRHSVQNIWNKHAGYIKYAVGNHFTARSALASISFSLELCSETNGYNHDYPSDITFWINDVELCSWTSPGDFGDKPGTYTPSWWYPESTKYGLLTTVAVKEKGVYLNGKLVNKAVTLDDLALSQGNHLTFTVGVKPDAEHVGGFNLFGAKFGNFNQHILLTATYKKF